MERPNDYGFDPSTGFFDGNQYMSEPAKFTNRDVSFIALCEE